MKHASCRRLYQYWASLRTVTMPVPSYADFRIQMVADLAPSIFIINNLSPDGLFKLAGSRLCDIFSGELKGTKYFDIWASDAASGLERINQCLVTENMPVVATAMLNGRTRTFSCEILLLPFKSDCGPVLIGIMALILNGTPASWSYIAAPGALSLNGFKPVRYSPDLRVADVFRPPVEANVIELSRRGRAPENGRKVGHLTVIEGGNTS